MTHIASRTNERVKAAAALLRDADARRQSGLCALPGIKLCEEAVKRGLLRELWVTEDALKRQAQRLAPLQSAAKETVVMSEPVCDKLSDQKSPTGVFGIAALPQKGDIAAARRILVLCDIQDPANVGAMLRTAAGIGYDGAVLCGGCADPFAPKTLRASMGACFSLPPAVQADAAALAQSLRQAGVHCVATALRADAVSLTQVPVAERMALFIGNEGHGLAEEVIDACDTAAIIPITDRVESLNAAAAAAIAMWELRP